MYFELILPMEHYQKWEQIRNSQSSTDPSSEPSEIPSETELWMQGNLNKKGRVYGLGSEGVKLKHLFKSTATSSGSQEPDVRETVTQLNNELSSMAELNHWTEERNRHLEEKVMMLSEQLSGVQNTLSEFIKSQQASSSGSHSCPSSRPWQHRRSTYAAAAPPPQPQCQNGDGDGDDHEYDPYSSYNYFNY